MTHSDDVDWTAVKVDYDRKIMSVASILSIYEISRSALECRIIDEGWVRRTKSRQVGRTTLISRLFKVLDRQVTQLERKIEDLSMADIGDKEVALLGNLTRNLEKLLDLERREKGLSQAQEKRTDIDVLRAKLAQRIEQLKRN